MTAIWIAVGVLGVLGLLMIVSVITRRGRRGVLTGAAALIGLALVGASGVIAMVGVNLRTWARLTHEQNVAEITFERLAPRLFTATVRQPDGTETAYDLRGDEWQLDARVIKFPPRANIAGLDALYRLDRLSGRYASVNDEVNQERTVYALAESPGIDLWRLARDRRGAFLNIDASFGSAVYHPMADGARYEIRMSQTSLVSRPLNDAAMTAVRGWDGRQDDE